MTQLPQVYRNRSIAKPILHVAEFYAVLGDIPKSINWLGVAVRNGDERVEWFRKNPLLASIRNDPNFQRIIDSIEARKQRKGK